MRVSLVPDRLFETYEEITPEYLRQRGIRLLLSDLDYTLAPKYVPHPDDRVGSGCAAWRKAGCR